MKTPGILAVFAGLAALPLTSCGPQMTTTPVQISSSERTTAGSLWKQVNAYRSSKGLAPLTRHPGLDNLAQQHAEYLLKNRSKFLAGRGSHDGFEGRAALARHKYNIMTLGENAAYSPRGGSLVQIWINSRAHERAMRGKWTLTGVGLAIDRDGMMFATQLFGTPPSSNSQMALRNRFGMY